MGCDGCVTHLSLEHPRGDGVGPAHSRKAAPHITVGEMLSRLSLGDLVEHNGRQVFAEVGGDARGGQRVDGSCRSSE